MTPVWLALTTTCVLPPLHTAPSLTLKLLSSGNAWIVTAAGEVVTHGADTAILNGVTRQGLLRVIEEAGLRLVERRFSVAEAKAAREALLTSSTNFVVPVVRIDDSPVSDGRPGPLARRLAALYTSYAASGGQDR